MRLADPSNILQVSMLSRGKTRQDRRRLLNFPFNNLIVQTFMGHSRGAYDRLVHSLYISTNEWPTLIDLQTYMRTVGRDTDEYRNMTDTRHIL